MKQWYLVIDIAKCSGCNNCFMVCKDEYWDNDHLPYSVAQPRHGQRWIDLLYRERGQYPRVDPTHLPLVCMHCEAAPCVARAKEGEVYQREDGLVIIDPEKARGKREIIDSCPYGVIYWNEEKNVPQKCTLCAHLLLGGWTEPRCVQACPTGALAVFYTDPPEMKKMIETEGLEIYCPEYQTAPRVYYKNLYKWTKSFIAGSVALREVDECAVGARVTLLNPANGGTRVTTTNNYGDFKFESLEPDRAKYQIKVEYPGYIGQALEVEGERCINVGTMFLEVATGEP